MSLMEMMGRGGGPPIPDPPPPPRQPEPGPPQTEQLNFDNPLGYAFGPILGRDAPYLPSNLDYPEHLTPLAPTIWLMGQEAPPDGATQYLDYHHGDQYPANWKDYKSTDRSTGGGFFTAGELFGENLPAQFGRGRDLPSTNNWRLLPLGTPGYIMRNGEIINLNSTQLYGPFGPVPTNQEGGPPWKSGVQSGSPAAWAWGHNNQAIGWPGQLGAYYRDTTANY
jgi:hypothetical protein